MCLVETHVLTELHRLWMYDFGGDFIIFQNGKQGYEDFITSKL